MTTEAIGIPSHLTAKVWPLIEVWVVDALSRGKADQTAADVRTHLAKTTMQLWLAVDDSCKGCCITEIVKSARGKSCNLVVVAGREFAAWQPLTETIKAWAREAGCVRLEASGRAGWERRVAGDGWTKVRTTIEMPL